MTAENGNGELRQLLEIKRAYRKDLTSLEEELRAKFEEHLADGKKRLRERYLENVVDAVFAEAAPMLSKPEPVEAPAVLLPEVTKCPECGRPAEREDKFCPECSYPLKEDVKDDAPVVITGRKFRARSRR